MGKNVRNFINAFSHVMPKADSLRRAFSMKKGGKGLGEQELALLEKLAGFLIKRGMGEPAIIFLESIKPLSFIGSQAMVFFRPILTTFFSSKDYERLSRILEKRESIDILIEEIKKRQ